jgi:four helix bundle protein
MMEPRVKSFTDLVVWQKSHRFVLGTYALSATFPSRELYGLTSQLRRACVSVPANIAEGFGRWSRTDKARLMNVAEGSLQEARYYLLLARDLSYGADPSLERMADEVSRLLAAYIRSLRLPNS